VKYLNLEQVLAIHKESIKRFGGSLEIRDKNLLESAILRPQMSAFGQDAYPDLFAKAGVLLHSLVKNHAFVDGNKRTGFGAMHLMLLINNYDLIADEKQTYNFVISVAKGEISEKEITLWLEKHSKKL